jgi:rare lipoprotein A (peptidoglycan hydrolase)
MKRILLVFFCFFSVIWAYSQTAGDFTMRGGATQQMTGSGLVGRHPSLPINSVVKVTNPANSTTIDVTITGRIDPSANRIIDLSADAMNALGLKKTGGTVVIAVAAPRRRSPPGQDQAVAAAAPAPEEPMGEEGSSAIEDLLAAILDELRKEPAEMEEVVDDGYYDDYYWYWDGYLT